MKNWEQFVQTTAKDWPAVPSPPDERDWPLQALAGPREIPDAASLKHYIPWIMKQHCPFCAAYALVGAMNAYFKAQGTLPPGGLSKKFLYWMAKRIDGLPPGTKGTTFRAVLKVATKIGVCPESLLPTDGDCSEPVITNEMIEAAGKYKLKAYARLNGFDEAMEALAMGKFVLAGTVVTLENWADGWIIEPKGFFKGGHATLFCEYDKNKTYQNYNEFITGANSWGPKWGFNGFYYMARHYAEYRIKDFDNMPCLFETWALQFENELTPRWPAREEIREFDVAPMAVNFGTGARTMLEMRELVELTGGTITNWDNNKKQATIVYPDRTLYVTLGQKQYRVVPR